jgi:hypothetical protein
MIKQIVSVTLVFSLTTSLYGAESKGQTTNNSNEFEVSQTLPVPHKETRNKTKKIPSLSRNNKRETVYDPITKLMWQDNNEVKRNDRNWEDAITYCDNLSFGGYSDWKLPDIKELLSIADMTRREPSIKKGFSNVRSLEYWSSSKRNYDEAWYLNFSGGGNWNNNYRKAIMFVRCVRNGN